MDGIGKIIALVKALAPGVDPSAIEQAVSDWLDDHPEATTTVEDGSITEEKLASDVLADLAEIGELKEAIAKEQNAIGTVPITLIANKYISLSGGSVDMYQNTPQLTGDSATYSVGRIQCSGGDVFTISGTGGASTRLWGFINSTGSIIARAKESASGDDIVIIAPEGATWLIVHTSDGKISYKGESLKEVGKLIVHEYANVGEIKQGSVSNSSGLPIDSTTRVYTDFIPFSPNMLVIVNGGLKFSARYYAQNGNFLGGDNEWTDGGGYVGNYGNSTGSFRLILANRNDATITPETVGTVKVLKASVSSTDKNLTETGKAADAKVTGDRIRAAEGVITPSNSMLGNVTIRAAKEIQFADGTPPQIDWYLVQTVDNKFYMSKDLVTKKYLFTTAGSGMPGYAANYSVGITPNNDVLFVPDAAALDTSVNGRLSDDNRINPYIFLASENYEKVHEIDFGSSLKPCGWLGNVGYCLLPDGNIAFCEYTRGTVKTANVWLIDGDITDPTNWTVTWSTDIIDTLDSTTPGIKHCHEMMWDFYTGILYFGTGDSDTGSYSYYSTDNGETWTLAYGPNKNMCRRLNYIFTADKVYWASDSFDSDNHHFFIAERDSDGVVDIENATSVNLTSGNGQACYGCVYLQDQGLIVLMDRMDDPHTTFNWYCIDLSDNAEHKIGEIVEPDGYATYLGFRCEFVDWYPKGKGILTGFNPRQAEGASDTNRNALCGNAGGGTGDGSTRINNLLMYVYKNGTNYSFRASTLWI